MHMAIEFQFRVEGVENSDHSDLDAVLHSRMSTDRCRSSTPAAF